MTMQALTVRQPFASRIVQGTKTVENRSWPTKIRGRIQIHAAQAPHELYAGKKLDHLPRMAIIGDVQLVDCHSSETCGDRCVDGGGFVTGQHAAAGVSWFHWVLEQPVAYSDADLVTGPGGLGFWSVETMFGPSRAYLVQLAAMQAHQSNRP